MLWVLILHFEQVSYIVQVFPLLTLNKKIPTGIVSSIV